MVQMAVQSLCSQLGSLHLGRAKSCKMEALSLPLSLAFGTSQPILEHAHPEIIIFAIIAKE